MSSFLTEVSWRGLACKAIKYLVPLVHSTIREVYGTLECLENYAFMYPKTFEAVPIATVWAANATMSVRLPAAFDGMSRKGMLIAARIAPYRWIAWKRRSVGPVGSKAKLLYTDFFAAQNNPQE